MGKTTIEWTATVDPDTGNVYPGYTFNPWWGCAKVSEACKFCYAETLATRWGKKDLWKPKGNRQMMSDKYWQKPISWNDYAGKIGQKLKVFCASMADIFEDLPELVGPRQRLYDLIEKAPNLIWLLLTKRPENIKKILPKGWHPDNIWIGTTAETQSNLEHRASDLILSWPGVKFLSIEPMLEEMNIRAFLPYIDSSSEELGEVKGDGIDWVIVGGESGRQARITRVEWVRNVRDQAAANEHTRGVKVYFHFKQWGEWVQESQYILGGTKDYVRAGKKNSGRLLDGKEWNECPSSDPVKALSWRKY